MSTETKVGAFVLAGLVLLAWAIFLLGDFSLEKRYPIFVRFNDVTGLAEDSQVKLSGVEVGKVRNLDFHDGKVLVEARIRKDAPVYRDAVISVGSTGLIGSKFLQIDQGKAASGTLPAGAEIEGQDTPSLEKSITSAFNSLQDLIGGLNDENGGKPGSLTRNLNATVKNVRELTATLNEMMSDVKPHMTDALTRMDNITAKLDSILAKTDQMMAALNSEKGTVGALMHDEKMKQDVQQTVASLKDVAGTAKDVFGRVNQFRVYWNYDWRYEHAIRTSRADIGLKISPRDERYYYVGGSNLGNISDQTRGTDYARKNTVDALLGFVWKGLDFGVGIIRSAGGARVSWTPVPSHPVLGRFSLMGQAYDFGRNRVIEGRKFTRPEYDVGAMVHLHRLVGVGARLEDLREVKRYQTWLNVNFEDKDVAYLFGLISFGAAGTKGRSKSN
ncbi:MAG: MCE family protein [Elusimicrobia bacterium]|nr:MCE family protein [Elusimicrobiota bacterium]